MVKLNAFIAQHEGKDGVFPKIEHISIM